MTVQLERSTSAGRGVGVRHDMERRIGSRRIYTRGTPERRRSVRRRARLRSLIFTSLALAVPHTLKHSALKLVSTAPRVTTNIDSMIIVPPSKAYEGIIREASAVYCVDAHLIRSVMQAESAFDPSAISRAGAMGLMQLMPGIVAAFDVEYPFDPRENIMAGTRLLRELLDQHRGNETLTLASYNAGPTAVARYRGVPPFKETRGYVRKITTLIADARSTGSND